MGFPVRVRVIRWGMICAFTERNDRVADEGHENRKANNPDPID